MVLKEMVMLRYDLLVTFRNIIRNKAVSVIHVAGLGWGAAFIFVTSFKKEACSLLPSGTLTSPNYFFVRRSMVGGRRQHIGSRLVRSVFHGLRLNGGITRSIRSSHDRDAAVFDGQEILCAAIFDDQLIRCSHFKRTILAFLFPLQLGEPTLHGHGQLFYAVDLAAAGCQVALIVEVGKPVSTVVVKFCQVEWTGFFPANLGSSNEIALKCLGNRC